MVPGRRNVGSGQRLISWDVDRVFNSGSPYNVQAGQTANLEALVAHYENKNRKDEEDFQKKRASRGVS